VGGAAGHLSHLYDNLGLTFGEIKEVLATAAEGKLERVSEKLDGANLVFTWDVRAGQLRVARTGGDIKGGGMDAAGLAKKFSGRGNVEEAFNSAFKVLHQALGSLGPDEQARVFGPAGNTWYSMEIIYAKDPNTINYDSNNIVFHGWPIFEVKPDGTVSEAGDDSGVKLLTQRIDQMQKAVTAKDWQVRGPSLLRLKKLGDGSILQKAVSQIDGAMAAGGVSEGDTVYDYLRNLFTDDVRALGLPAKAYKMTVERCATGAPSVNDIKKETPKELQATVQAYVKASDGLKAKWMAPIESAIHFFAIEVLRGLHSTLIAKSDDEVARLRSQLARAIRTIQASGHERAMDVLQKEMSRLGNVENMAAAMEGIVFFFKGQAYKFTGAFAPVHQIMALFKYGRKDIPKMDLGERALRDALRSILSEGAGSFDDINPISMADFKHVWPALEADLEMLGLTDIEPIGTTGKKQLMGDVDVAGRFEGGAPALFGAAEQVFGKGNVRKGGGSVVSIRYEMDVPAFQVDVMVGDPKYLRWSRYGPSTTQGHPEFSPVKGLARNLLFNIITRFTAGRDFPGAQQSDTERTRYTVDWDRGLWKVVQTKRPARAGGKPNKGWRDVDRKLVTDDPDKLVQHLFGKGFRAEGLRKLEDVVAAIKESPALRGVRDDILGTFVKELPNYGEKLGGDAEGVIDYVTRLVQGR
jgi:hypothetical protein